MPERAFNLLLALAGVMAVGALLLCVADPVQSARMGSRWKRRLIIAGLALLAILGVYVSRNTLRDWVVGVWAVPTCYEMVRIDDIESTPERVAARVKLLKEFAAQNTLEPEVVRQQLSAIDQDLDAMQYAERTQKQNPEDLRRMAEVRREANKLKDELKARLEEQK